MSQESIPHATLKTIKDSIPHRNSMLLVDQIVSQEQEAIVCRKQFHSEEFFFDGHYPGNPIVPGVILCESAVQSGAILLAKVLSESPDRIPVLTRMNDIKFKAMVKPGQIIENTVKIDDVISSAYYMTAQVRCEGKLVARLSFTCSLAPKS